MVSDKIILIFCRSGLIDHLGRNLKIDFSGFFRFKTDYY